MIIDAYAHDVPEEFYKEMGRVHPSESHANHTNIGGFFDYDRRIEHLNEFSIDKQVIALGGPHFWHGIDPSDAAPLVKLANDEMREIADKHPDRYIPVGTIPAQFDGMVEEVERCINDLDMAGIQLYSNYDGTPIDNEAFHPIYELAEEKEIPVWLHPQHHRGADWLDEYVLNLNWGWIFETTLALSRLVLSGLMERYSGLNLIAHHGGGMIPHFIERIKTIYGGTHSPEFDYAYEQLTRPIEEYFQEFYVDTVLYGAVPPLETVYEFYGADQMLFATDYPYGGDAGRVTLEECTTAFNALGLPEDEHEQILEGNIRSLVDI